MWYQYRKSPLGTVIRESMKTILGIYPSREEAIDKIAILSEKIMANIKIVDIKQNLYEILSIDPDLGDFIWKNIDKSYIAVITTWDPLDK